MLDHLEGGRRGQDQPEEPPTDTGTSNETDTSTDTQETNSGAGHMSKTSSWKVGFFVEKVETQTTTPPDYPSEPPGGKA